MAIDLSLLILVVSVVLQLTAAVAALRLIRVTGRKRAWTLIAVAFTLMAFRRALTLVRIYAGMPLTPIAIVEESVEVAVSAIVLAGVWGIRPIFQSAKAGWEAAVESEREYRRLFDHANDAILIFEPGSEIILEANPKASEAYGVPRDTLVGTSLKAFTQDVPKGEEQIRAILDAGGFRNFETVHHDKDGIRLHFLVNSTRLEYKGRTAVLSINRDITDRKRAEEMLSLSEARLRHLVQRSPAVIYTCRTDGDYDATFVSDNVANILGHEPEDFVRNPGFWINNVHPDDRQRILPGLLDLRAKGRYSHEYRFRHKDGGYRWIRDDLALLRDPEGRPAEIIGAMVDISERKVAEEALADSERRYRLLFERNQAAIFRTTLDGRILDCNEAYAQLLGYRTCDEMRTHNSSDFYFSAEDRKDLIAKMQAEGGVSGLEMRLRRKDGSELWVLENVAVSFDGNEGETLQGTFVDITERKRAEEARLEAEERFRATFEQSAVGFAMTSSAGRFLLVNQKLCEITGYAEEELLTKTFQELTHPDDLPADLRLFSGLLTGESSTYSREKRYIRKDGSVIWIALTVSRIIGPDGNARFFMGAVQDISDRKHAEEALKESESRYRTIFEGVADGIYRSSPEGRPQMANPALMRMLGYQTLEDLLNRDIEQDGYVDPAERHRFTEIMERDGTVRDFVSEWRRPDGSSIHVIENARAVCGSDGRIVAYEGTVRDITERKKSWEERQLLSTTIEQAHEGVVITDLQGNIRFVNPAVERMSGYAKDELLGQNPRILRSGIHDPSFYQSLWETITSGKVWSGRITNRRKDLSLYVEDMIVSPVRDANGTISAFVATKRDVTKEVDMQRRLQQAKKLETIGMIAGGVAHEVRNPLFAITTVVAALQKKLAEQPEFAEYVTHIMDQSRRLNTLMEDLLSLGRPVDPGQFSPCVVQDLMEETLGHIEKAYPPCRQRFTLDFPEDDLIVSGISGKLVQVFQNTFQNALSFSPEGTKVQIRGSRENGSAVIACIDSGPGIQESMMAKLFEPFASRRKGGTGLGLAIVQKIVEAHGGIVEAANNAPSPGATFTVRLPLEGTSDQPSAISY